MVASHDRRVIAALRCIEERFREPRFGIRDVAQELELSVEHLCRLVKRETTRSFGAHLHRLRILEAKRLLRETKLSAKEIAYRVGYQSTVQLDRHFKSAHASPPMSYRRLAK